MTERTQPAFIRDNPIMAGAFAAFMDWAYRQDFMHEQHTADTGLTVKFSFRRWMMDVKVYASAIGSPPVVVTEPIKDKELKILKRLELLSGDGQGDYGMIARRHLKASADAMQVLWFKGLVDGRGLRDAHGYGNTPDSSIWGITRLGRKAILQPKAPTS